MFARQKASGEVQVGKKMTAYKAKALSMTAYIKSLITMT